MQWECGASQSQPTRQGNQILSLTTNPYIDRLDQTYSKNYLYIEVFKCNFVPVVLVINSTSMYDKLYLMKTKEYLGSPAVGI